MGKALVVASIWSLYRIRVSRLPRFSDPWLVFFMEGLFTGSLLNIKQGYIEQYM